MGFLLVVKSKKYSLHASYSRALSKIVAWGFLLNKNALRVLKIGGRNVLVLISISSTALLLSGLIKLFILLLVRL